MDQTRLTKAALAWGLNLPFSHTEKIMQSRLTKITTAGIAMALLSGHAGAAIIIDDDVDGSGDAAALTGTIDTAWTGWNGVIPGFGLVPSDLLPLANAVDDVDAGFPDSLLTSLPDDAPAPFFNTGSTATVTYDGVIAAGTYTLRLQVLNWNNEPFVPITVDFASLTETSSTTTTPASGDDEIWVFNYVVGTSAPEIGNALALSLAAGGSGGNSGVDHVQIDFVPVPEPTSLALLGLGGLCVLRRRRG